MRDLLGRGYADAAHQAGAGLTPTWPNGRGLPPFITIDHILVDERAGVSSFDVLDVPGTDHRGCSRSSGCRRSGLESGA
ncbi:endonuclease/exonuclease/phosphatase family protein [Nonomuraea ferruginea]